MELIHDWRAFQSIFYPRPRPGANKALSPITPVYLVTDKNLVISAFAENEDLRDWSGAPMTEVAAESRHRPMVALEKKDVDKWLQDSLGVPNFHDQVEYLRSIAPIPFYRHFLLEGMNSWWAKVLPSSYGLFIRLEGQNNRDFLLLVRRGKVHGFHEPDLSSLGPERLRHSADVVKYLSEKYLVPVQGVFLPQAEWSEWIESEHPWREVARAIRVNRVKLVPFRWPLVTLVATRAFLGV